MPPKPTQISIAGTARRAAARSHDAGQRRNPDDQAREARELSDLGDRLQGLMALERPTTADHERKVALIEELAARWCAMRQHYRGPSTRLCHPPLHVAADGRSACW